jgi:hypothetical protein
VLGEALVHAAQNERVGAADWLLTHRADPYQGCGALHLAAAFGAIESVRLLVAAGVEVDRRLACLNERYASPVCRAVARATPLQGRAHFFRDAHKNRAREGLGRGRGRGSPPARRGRGRRSPSSDQGANQGVHWRHGAAGQRSSP